MENNPNGFIRVSYPSHTDTHEGWGLPSLVVLISGEMDSPKVKLLKSTLVTSVNHKVSHKSSLNHFLTRKPYCLFTYLCSCQQRQNGTKKKKNR